MTSNLASDVIESHAEDRKRQKKEVDRILKTHFRPEFLNRLDDIIIFQHLSREELKQIVELRLTEIVKRLEKKEIHLQVSEALKDHLVEVGFDPLFGARPLKRAIQNEILDSLSLKIIEGEISEGQSVTADFSEQGVDFKI
jgi:ATP-dependent Clp protease ATP-binding subunit ClpB